MDDRRFTVMIAAAGCLPDSDDYPYTVEGLLGAEAALKTELDRALIDDYDADEANAIECEALKELREHEATTVDIGGSYSLTIELQRKPAHEEAGHMNHSDGLGT